MSSTIKQAIQALKSRIADAYTAVSNKGGTLPATQDSANLPTAIASIPAGDVQLIDTIEYTATADLANTQGFFDAVIAPYQSLEPNNLYVAVIENSVNQAWSSRCMIYALQYSLENKLRYSSGSVFFAQGYRGPIGGYPYDFRGISVGYDFHNGVGDKITLYIYKPIANYIDLSKI